MGSTKRLESKGLRAEDRERLDQVTMAVAAQISDVHEALVDILDNSTLKGVSVTVSAGSGEQADRTGHREPGRTCTLVTEIRGEGADDSVYCTYEVCVDAAGGAD